MRNQDLSSDAAFEQLLVQIREEIGHAIARVRTAEPDYFVMGMSAETFWDGLEGNRAFVGRVRSLAGGLGVATGAEACERALKLFEARRIGVVTPYQPIGDKNVVRFFGDLGFEVVAIRGLRCPTAVSIAHVAGGGAAAGAPRGRQARSRRAGAGRHQPEHGAAWPTRPSAGWASRVLAINAATWWLALRDNGIQDKVYGAGRLLREY